LCPSAGASHLTLHQFGVQFVILQKTSGFGKVCKFIPSCVCMRAHTHTQTNWNILQWIWDILLDISTFY
jgi:hypothetical protein